MKRLSLIAIAALIPFGTLICASWWIIDRVRTRNRVMYVARDFGTPRVTVTAFVPAKFWHGRA